ncbi:MAG: outer membrane beta-barrel protein [Bacteroidetes bacterium]|nr:outer membrane beta-barrel protein [Bacteroidota bacterium]
MRKTLLILIFACAISSVSGQERPYKIGIKAGVNYIHLENYGKGYYSDFDPKPGWSFGALFQYKKGAFVNYSIVPEILFTTSTTDVDLIYITDCITTIQTIDIPINFKLGLQLSKIFRPYILGNVFGSYIVAYEGDLFYMLDDMSENFVKADINKLYFGVSAGLGFDLWKFQIEGRYRWNLNRINSQDYSTLKQMGMELSCAFLF